MNWKAWSSPSEEIGVEKKPVAAQEVGAVHLVAHKGDAATFVEQGIDPGMIHVVAPREGIVRPRERGERLAAEDDDVGAFPLGGSDEDLAGPLRDVVVGVDEQDVLAARKPDAHVARLGNTAVLAMERADASVFRGVGIEELRRAVDRAVVQTENLDIGKRLLDQAIQALREIAFDVVDGDNDRNLWIIHIVPSVSFSGAGTRPQRFALNDTVSQQRCGAAFERSTRCPSASTRPPCAESRGEDGISPGRRAALPRP